MDNCHLIEKNFTTTKDSNCRQKPETKIKSERKVSKSLEKLGSQ